jgi:nitroreductase
MEDWMEAIEAMRKRRSVRAFKADPVPREVVEQIVDCGRLAATAVNVQPWEFVAVTSEPTRRRIAALADHGSFIAQAPACIVVLARDTTFYLEDCCAATQNLLNAATAFGLGSCWVAGDKKPSSEQIRNLVGAPEGYKLVSLVALGTPAEDPSPPKRPLSKVLHWEKF